MHRLVSILAALVLLFALSATALGASPSQTNCEAAGGTFTKSGGTVSCTFMTDETVGNAPDNSNAQRVESTETESSNGTLNNKPKHGESSECDGPGNGGSGAQCP
jgi:hypothetical protein